ncbi:probable E3 ubiquitin-protein ligase makorin-1 [Anneissia japonica]|uniref:probable E3 ubiquitin-protein ligase makorin-1 n=1 Tax=Anneissia japonica TaxID=1529436 RepID=UPI0014259A03|nr:probable E3 ubiquitin-protein ligase makorin-1 [Anneissia japonica]
MAAVGINYRKIPCRFFLNGKCNHGSNCKYSHDQSNKPSSLCVYYLEGRCMYGDKCRFDHDKELASTFRVPTTTMKLDDSLSKMTILKREGNKDANDLGNVTSLISCSFKMEDCIGAAEFVPGKPYQGKMPSSYSAAASSGVDVSSEVVYLGNSVAKESKQLLCPFLLQGNCPKNDQCPYTHGDRCEYCRQPCLHPDQPDLNKEHIKECIAHHEEEMEKAFAYQRSKDVQCGICMEVILEKSNVKERKFGVLSDCKHPYCLSCIRKWRSAKHYEKKVVRGCPTCRIPSNFVTPSDYWVEDPEEKKKIIDKYKSVLGNKHCKYFNKGKGSCPFSGNCFYLHEFEDGTKEDPATAPRRGRNAQGGHMLNTISLWDFLEERENMLFDWESEDDDLWFLYYDWSDDYYDTSDYDDDFSDYVGLGFSESDDDDDVLFRHLSTVAASSSSTGTAKEIPKASSNGSSAKEVYKVVVDECEDDFGDDEDGLV